MLTPNTMDTTHPIIIVGAGPVGLTLALVLARYGVSSLVLEAREAPTPRDESRAITWMPRGLELLDWLGLGHTFAEAGVLRRAHEFWANGRPLLALPFDAVDTIHNYTLQLPQHDTETLLGSAALATDRVEIRRGHRVVAVGGSATEATVRVEGFDGTYDIAAPWAVGCDGFWSNVRKGLGIATTWRDYGAYSAVADFEMECDLPDDVSRVVLDAAQPYGFFYFAPGRWRLIYRLNKGEDRKAMTTEAAATALLHAKLPGARVDRFLWASAFRLGSAQSSAYRQGRWLLAGDAAHAMGPSAGAGMMVGVLGAWRLAWRLALAAQGHPRGAELLDDYGREQCIAADEVQDANALIFRSIALTNPVAAALRGAVLRGLARLPFFTRQLTAKEALVSQILPVSGAADKPGTGAWKELRRLGAWHVGRRMPTPVIESVYDAHRVDPLSHLMIPIGRFDAQAEADLAAALVKHSPAPAQILAAPPDQALRWRQAGASGVAVALVRPDQHVVAIYGRP